MRTQLYPRASLLHLSPEHSITNALTDATFGSRKLGSWAYRRLHVLNRNVRGELSKLTLMSYGG